MPATRDGKMWRSQFYYKDWQGVSHKKNKRGFRTKAEAERWERDFLQQQQRNLDINFENFVQIYYEDMEHRLRENTMKTKKFIIDLKIIPYFKNKKMNEIKASDVRAWQNALMKKGYSQTYLKTVNNQLSAIFNYAVKYYDLRDNPCRKAGSIGKSHAGERQFWTKQEFKQFLVTVEDKPEARMAFLLLYWTGMRIGELLALTYNDIDLEKRTISINKSYQRLDGRDIITPPKTPKSKRIVTIPPFLAEELRDYMSHLYGIMADERMFRFTKSYMEHEIIRGIKASFAYPIACIVIRYFVRPVIYGKLQMNFYSEVMAEYLTNYMCFTALSVEIFSILFIYGIVKNVVVILFVDTVILIGLLVRGLTKKNSGGDVTF